jgi:hypothetical protein
MVGVTRGQVNEGYGVGGDLSQLHSDLAPDPYLNENTSIILFFRDQTPISVISLPLESFLPE